MTTALNPAWVAGITGGKGASAGPAYITGTGGTNSTTAAKYFTDSNGQPKLWAATETWGLPTNAGRWNGSGGGTYQQDFDNFFASRSAQGFTVLMTDALGNIVDGGVSDNGNTWDGVAPFTTGTDPSSGLNNTFWTRIDYMMNSAKNNGITIAFDFNLVYDAPSSGHVMFGWTATQYQDYGNKLGTRYGSQPNLVWLFGNDEFQGTNDTHYSSIMTGLTAASDTHMRIVWWSPEYTSRYEADNNAVCTLGVNNSVANFCYSYNATYWIIEYAYGEVANQGAAALLGPVILGDGYFYQGGTTYSATLDRAVRQDQWWTLASGGRGFVFEDVGVEHWDAASAIGQVTSHWYPANNQHNITSTFQGWTDWHKLIPDTGNALVTAGRGTRVTGFASGGGHGQYEPAFTNSYVAASITPTGNLAVCYLPNATTITVNTALLISGWTASWIDPVTAAASSAGTGPTFNSTAKGSNSQGNPDWVLVFRGP